MLNDCQGIVVKFSGTKEETLKSSPSPSLYFSRHKILQYYINDGICICLKLIIFV